MHVPWLYVRVRGYADLRNIWLQTCVSQIFKCISAHIITVKTTAIAHKTSALTVARHAEESSSASTGGGGEAGGSSGGGIGGGGTHVVSASLAADVSSAATAASTAKLSKLEASIPGIAPNSSSIGSVSVDVAVTPSASRLSSALVSALKASGKDHLLALLRGAVEVLDGRFGRLVEGEQHVVAHLRGVRLLVRHRLVHGRELFSLLNLEAGRNHRRRNLLSHLVRFPGGARSEICCAEKNESASGKTKRTVSREESLRSTATRTPPT